MKLDDLKRLDPNQPGEWPLPIKLVCCLMVVAAVGGIGYYMDTESQLIDLDKAVRKEGQLREEFLNKTRATAHLPELRKQIDQLTSMFEEMRGKLPTETQMPDLLAEISNTGRQNGLVFSLFKPQPETPKDFYAAKPIAIEAKGSFHQLGTFSQQIASLSRIVAVDSVTLSRPDIGRSSEQRALLVADDQLDIDIGLLTYRYFDQAASGPSKKTAKGAAAPKSTPPKGGGK